MKPKDYDKNMRKVAKETSNISSMKFVPRGKVLCQTFDNLFYIEHELKHLFVNKPTFAKYTEANEVYKRMVKLKLPDEDAWEN